MPWVHITADRRRFGLMSRAWYSELLLRDARDAG